MSKIQLIFLLLSIVADRKVISNECAADYEVEYVETYEDGNQVNQHQVQQQQLQLQQQQQQQPQRDLVQPYNCEAGWKMFGRVKGMWCIKFFHEEGKTWDYSQEACKKLNANLTGIESLEERQFIHDEGLPIVKQQKRKSCTIWVGGHRTAACKDMAPGCNAQNSYEWIDGHTTGTSMFYWTPNNPSVKGNEQQCVRLYSVDGTDGYDGSKPQQIDDTECSWYYLGLDLIGYACGKPAVAI